MKKIPTSLLCLFYVLGSGVSLRGQEKVQLPVCREMEQSGNLYAGSHNPTSLWFSPLDDVLEFHADYKLERGDWHDVDESSKTGHFGVGISGQRRFSKVVCSGSIVYDDGKEYGRRWNSTLQIADDNPFILGDSIASDFNIQRFRLSGNVAYHPFERLTLALQLDYDTGSSANQTDPRPKTDGMHFVITPGIHYGLGSGFSLGLSGSFDLMSESITHDVIDPRESYVYFRFNGLGDFSTISTGTSLSYPRDYNGTEYTGAMQFAWDGGRGVSNLLEARYASNTEEARDGGAAFTFLGGDYTRTGFCVTDRIRVATSRRIHTLTVGWEHKLGKGIWYEQTAYTDPDKNNQLSYKVQSSGLKNRETQTAVRGEYRFDQLREALPRFTLDVAGRFEQSETLHYEGDGYNRRYSRVTAAVTASKYFYFGRNQLTATLGAAGGSALSSSQNAPERLLEGYTAPAFEYLTGTWLGGQAQVRYRRLFGNLWVGLYAHAALACYQGDNRYSARFEGSNRQRYTFGAEILF